jgi:hypothetical protein
MSSPMPNPQKDRPATAFLSYAHEDGHEVISLQQQFTLRGVHAWRDVTNLPIGGYTREEITYAIEHNCDAFLLYITPAALKSQFIWDVEVPAAHRRREHDHLFAIIPIFRNVTLTRFKRFCARRNYPDLSEFNGAYVPEIGAEENEETIRIAQQAIARRTLFEALKLRLRRIEAQPDYEPRMGFRNFRDTPQTDSLDLDLYWPESFEEKLAGQQEWDQLLRPALQDVKDTLSEMKTSRVLHLFLQARLPFAFALGALFPYVARFTLLTEGKNGIWKSSDVRLEEPEPLRVSNLEPGRGEDAIIELAISRNTELTVTPSLATLGLSYGHRIKFEPTSGVGIDVVKDGAHAAAMASQIGRELRRLRDGFAIPRMHLFAAVPVELATLIGHQFNALGPITLYHLPPNSSTYIPAWTL